MKRRAFRLAPCRTAAQGRRELTGLQANTNCGSYLSQAACISGIVGFPPSTARFQSRHSATATTRHDSGWLCGPNRSRLNRRLLAPLETRPFKPASLAVLEGVEKFRALRRAFLRDRDAALSSDADFIARMGALDRCEIQYRQDKEALFKALPHPTRQAVWDRL
jgi:hypothetical protein